MSIVIRTHAALFGNRTASFSLCERYRYMLEIVWDDHLPACNFLMLNPSKANEIENDPTVERCERRARSWGYGSLVVTNLFAFRATDPADMKAAADPVGPENDHHILDAAKKARLVVCGWGTHGGHQGRSSAVREMLAKGGVELHALKVCAGGECSHPLYISYEQKPVRWKR